MRERDRVYDAANKERLNAKEGSRPFLVIVRKNIPYPAPARHVGKDTDYQLGQKIQTYYFRSAYRSFLSEEKIVQLHADMQARDLMEVSIITEHCESVL